MIQTLLRFLPLRLINKKPLALLTIALICLCIWQYILIRDKNDEISSLRVAYENPQVKEVVKTVRVQGPVRVEYRNIIEKVPGEKEIIEKIVYREAETTVTDTAKESTPISIQKPVRKDRVLVGGSVTFPEHGDDYKSINVGYSLSNRLDLVGGIAVSEEKNYSLQALLRL